MLVQRRGAEEAFEACLGYVGGGFMVDVALVICVEGVLLGCEGVGLEGDFEFVGRFDVRF